MRSSPPCTAFQPRSMRCWRSSWRGAWDCMTELAPHQRSAVERALELLGVDGAHGFRNPRTQRWAALARRSVGARLMLVTATPVCNSADDLLSLISLIAADDALRPLGVASIERAFAIRNARALDTIVS